jgi:hypothetical protein
MADDEDSYVEGDGYTSDIPLVYMELVDAYSFRCLIEYLNYGNVEGNFIFTPKTITYSNATSNNQVLNEIIIHGHELTKYEYNYDKEELVVGVSLTQFKSSTKKIGKKDIARLSVMPSGICLQIIGSPKVSSGDDMDLIRTYRLEKERFVIDGYQDITDPNFVDSIQKFTSLCSYQAACKDDDVIFIGLERGIMTEARHGGDLRASLKNLGQVDDSSSRSEKITKTAGKQIRVVKKHRDEITRCRVPRDIVAALGKLGNISPNGTVKGYIQPGLPLKFVLHISTYGELNIHLRNKENK